MNVVLVPQIYIPGKSYACVSARRWSEWHGIKRHLLLTSNNVIQELHKAVAHVLGNVTYTEVVVNSAGLAALSAQT